jgi:hypothetical protein
VHGLVTLAVVRFGLQLSLGPEYDSNANRAEVVANVASPDRAIGSFLLRSTASGQLSWRSGPNLLRTSAGVGGKVFFNPAVADQTVFVVQAAAEDRVRVARFLHVALNGDYYDAWQLPAEPMRHRDFRTGSAIARLYFVDRLGEVQLSGGYRGFQYKPDHDSDFDAVQASANSITRSHFGRNGDHELDLFASYHFEQRLFAGLSQYNQCPLGGEITDDCLLPGRRRRDTFEEGGIELTYVGPLLVALGYGAQLNTSNSFGQSLLRNMLTLKVAFRLPGSLYATLKAQLFITKYLDPVLLDHVFNSQTFVTIDDENRNAVLVDLERPIPAIGLAVNARYSVYTNELTTTNDSFLRQVIYVGLTYRAGAR